jgi:WD40 repeat protein
VEPSARISPHTILGMVIQGLPKRVHRLNPQAPPELIAICEKAMAREKRDRYASSLDLAEDLQAFLDHRVVRAYRTGAVAEFASWVKRNKTVATVVGAATLLLVLGSAAFIIQQKQANERLRLNSYVAELNVASHELAENNLARAVDLLERQIPRHGEKDLRGFEWRYLWQRSRGNQLHSFPGHTKYVSSLAFSPSGRLLASASWDNLVQVVDVVSKQVIATLTNVTTGAGWIDRYALAFSPDGKTLAAHSGYGVRLYNTTTWSEFKTLTETRTAGFHTIAFSPDGHTFAALRKEATNSSSRIVFWDPSTWALRPLNIQTNLEGFGCLIAYSPDGKLLATASMGSTPGTTDRSGQVQFWEAGTGKLLGTSPVLSPRSIAFSRDGRWLGIGDESGLLWLWDAATLQRYPEPIKADSSLLWSLVFSAASQRLITAGIDQVVRVWDLVTLNPMNVAAFKPTRLLQGHTSEIWSLALSPDGQLLAGGTKDGEVLLWNAEAGIEEPGFAEAFEPLAFSSDSRNVLTCGTNFTFTWFDLGTQKPINSLTLPITSTNSELKMVSSDGSLAAITTSSHQLEIWDLPRAQRLTTLTNVVATFGNSVRFSEDNQFLVAVCTWPVLEQAGSQFSPDTAEVWEVTGRHLRSFTNLYPHAISADGRMIAGETIGYHSLLVNVRAKPKKEFPVGHKVHITGSAFSPDGHLLATSSYDGDVRLWDIQTGQLTHRMFGHKQGVLTVAFSPDGRTLVSGSYKGDVKFWSVATGKELLSVRLPTEESIVRAKFSPDGRTLVLQNTRHILRVPLLAEIDATEKVRPQAP